MAELAEVYREGRRERGICVGKARRGGFVDRIQQRDHFGTGLGEVRELSDREAGSRRGRRQSLEEGQRLRRVPAEHLPADRLQFVEQHDVGHRHSDVRRVSDEMDAPIELGHQLGVVQ